MIQKINHLSDFGSLGGVQSYLMGLKRFANKEITLFSTKKTIEIYADPIDGENINYLSFFNFSLFNKKKIFIIHNFILAKIWPFLEKSQTFFKKPIIYHEHGTAWHNPTRDKDKYKKRIAKVDCIIVNSKATEILLKKIYGINQKINILRPPIYIYENDPSEYLNDGGKFYESILKKNKIILGYIGRLEKHKNPIFLLMISDFLKSYYGLNVEIEYVGSGPEKELLVTSAEEQNINVKFHGLVKKPGEYIKNWDFVIFPSLREPLGLVQGEVALLNKICLSSNIDGIPELYPPSTPELLIKMVKNKSNKIDKNNYDYDNYQFINEIGKFDRNYSPDIKDCAVKIIKLINDPNLCKSLLEKHRKFIYENFTIEKHFFEMKKILKPYLIK